MSTASKLYVVEQNGQKIRLRATRVEADGSTVNFYDGNQQVGGFSNVTAWYPEEANEA